MRVHRFLLSLAMLAGCGMATAATAPVTGLGQPWPNVPDVSMSGHFHVYVFERDGIRYIQVNDLAGTVRGAVALVGGDALDLPMGVDANHWVSASERVATGETIYQDEATTISVAPKAGGSMQLLLQPCNPLVCSVKGP